MAETTAARSPRKLKACDTCRSRKIKCHYPVDDTVCRGCRSSGTSCTQEKIRRKRGPAKRSTLRHTPRDEAATTSPASSSNAPSIPQPTAGSPLGSQHAISSPSVADINSQASPTVVSGGLDFHGLCSRSLVLSILTDWSRFVWPLASLLHKKRFLRRVLQREDERNPTFCALVLSTCAVTVTTLRRNSFHKYRGVTVAKCIGLIEQGQMLQRPAAYTLDWCISCYNVASSLHALDGDAELRVYQAIKDAMAGVQWLLFCDGERETRSLHDQEMLKRLYWLMSMWQLAAELRGEPYLSYLPCRSFTQILETMRPLPLSDAELGVPEPDVDIPVLWPGVEETWMRDDEQYITGLNSLIDIMLVWEDAKVDMTHKSPTDTLREGMARIQAVLDNLIPELRWSGGLARYPQPCRSHEAQTVNILITSLYLRSNLLQNLGQIPGITHQGIVSDVLEILEHISEEVQEANGFSLVKKVRDIGAAYLQELRVTGDGTMQAVDESAQRTVNTLLARLERLDSGSRERGY
ncbi:Glucose transport transcription regulator RGT1 like protein [Verticillium longisporum]|nr:Glucose transport transcription regulator RGT1 like protein [Verticillium longisporum]KAG7117467.1 Glucose transport transcription regulator RGT1 like protein [Verticillium longisporum]